MRKRILLCAMLMAFTLAKGQDISVEKSIFPSWGLRRNLGQHFNFETGVGIGYVYYFAKNAGYSENEGEVALNILLKIGYKFKSK